MQSCGPSPYLLGADSSQSQSSTICRSELTVLSLGAMSNTPWMLLCNAWSLNTVSPGRFVLDRDNPQDNYDPKDDTSKAPAITVTDIDDLSVLDRPSTDSKVSLNLSMFAAKFFGKSQAQTAEMKTSKVRRYVVNDPSAWLDEIAAMRIVQGFMESASF